MNPRVIFSTLAVLVFMFLLSSCQEKSVQVAGDKKKLYWFIPDGMRAEPDLFNIYKWAEEGKLPNIKRMMDRGAYGFAVPVFPSHTPVNFATLFTGQLPKNHLVADGPMHVEGRPLNVVSVGGFSSAAKKSEPIWVTLEKHMQQVFLLSVPGSTPPELESGTTIRGRWGGWGADFHAVNFEFQGDNAQQYKQGRTRRLFTFGPPLTRYVAFAEPDSDWENLPKSYGPAKQVSLKHYGASIYGLIYDNSDDRKTGYNRILLSYDKKRHVVDLAAGEWSGWKPITILWKSAESDQKVETSFKIKVIKLDSNGFFRIRFLYDNLNEYIAKPAEAAEDLRRNVGPMVDFVDNFPPQLIYYPEDKMTFLEEMHMSFDWHAAAAKHLLSKNRQEIFIGDIYSPNQMLTSRWWLGYIDPKSARYGDVEEKERSGLWDEIYKMYQRLDEMIGILLENSDENTYIVLSSDHGACPLDQWVRLNNLFAKKGWLKFSLDKNTGEPIINWEKSTVIYLKMDNIYIHPAGLAGNWQRGHGEAYEKLRDEVINALVELRDPKNGRKPVVKAVKWEDAEEYLDLPKERVGDVVVANAAGYGWNEEMTDNLEIFSTPLKTGYKQAILPGNEKCIWTPFMIVGPKVKKNFRIKEIVRLQDEYPTLMHLLKTELPHEVDGRVMSEIIDN